MRTLAYFPNNRAFNSGAVMRAFEKSASKHFKLIKNSLDCDMAVIWSCLWAGRMRGNKEIYDHYRAQNKTVIIIEVGAIERGTTWKIALNHITSEGIYGNTKNLDPDRPKKLGLELVHQHKGDNGKILLAGQHLASHQLYKLDNYENWLQQQIEEIRKHTDRRIVIRPHPRSQINQNNFPLHAVRFQIPLHLTNTYDSFNINFSFHCLVNYNSFGPAFGAIMHGCPVIVDKTSLCHPVSNTYKDIEQLKEKDQTEWLLQIAHTEYTVEEIRNGDWYKRLEEYLG